MPPLQFLHELHSLEFVVALSISVLVLDMCGRRLSVISRLGRMTKLVSCEFLWQDAMDRLMHGRTVLVIAHRLSTVQSADIVAVVSDGIIAEKGTHEDLLDRNGIYASLVRRQLQGPTRGSTSTANIVGE